MLCHLLKIWFIVPWCLGPFSNFRGNTSLWQLTASVISTICSWHTSEQHEVGRGWQAARWFGLAQGVVPESFLKSELAPNIFRSRVSSQKFRYFWKPKRSGNPGSPFLHDINWSWVGTPPQTPLHSLTLRPKTVPPGLTLQLLLFSLFFQCWVSCTHLPCLLDPAAPCVQRQENEWYTSRQTDPCLYPDFTRQPQETGRLWTLCTSFHMWKWD